MNSLEREFLRQSLEEEKSQQKMSLQFQQSTIENSLNSVNQYVEVSIGDRYTGATVEQIRIVVREILTELESLGLNPNLSTENKHFDSLIPFKRPVFNLGRIEKTTSIFEVIQELYNSGYLSTVQISKYNEFNLQFQNDFNSFNENIVAISELSAQLLQEVIDEMRLQLDALKLAGRELYKESQFQPIEIGSDCLQAETQLFQEFVDRLENSRIGADWITGNIDLLIDYATSKTLDSFPNLNLSSSIIDDFRFSLKQFLEQVNFCLYWGSYEILDSPEIPLVLGIDQYAVAFHAVKESIPQQLERAVSHEIEACLDYLINHLKFY